MTHRTLLLVLLVVTVPGLLHAETVDVGGIRLEIPAPAGYASISGQPELVEVWRSDTHPSATLLAGFMSVQDLKAWQEQKDFEYGFYNAFAQVDRLLASMPAGQSLISGIAEQADVQLREEFAPAFVAGAGGNTIVNPSLELDEPALVSVDIGQHSYVNVLMYNIPSEDYPLTATAQVLVGGRIIDLVMEGYYQSDADIDALKRGLTAWIAAVIAANE